MRYLLLSILVGFMFIIGSTIHTSAQGYMIITNHENSVDALTKKEISDFFLKKKTTFSNSLTILPVDLSSGSTIRIAFSEDIHNKTVTQVRAYWQQSVFSGKASPPTEMENDQAVINYVKTHKGAIGYIASKNASTSVKIINIK
jgi:ABC-type phosphate transport system substrate-binding protein